MVRFNYSKSGAKRTDSQLIGRTFDSKREAARAEELYLLQQAGEISALQFQVSFRLCDKPKIAIKIDFAYLDKGGKQVYEDTKGYKDHRGSSPATREFRVKLAWLKEKYGVDVVLSS